MHWFQLPVEEELLRVMIQVEMDHGIGAVPAGFGIPS